MAGFDNEILYSNGIRLEESGAQDIFLAQKTNSVSELNISGSPEGVVSANPSSLAHDRSSSSGDIYQKVSGTGNTGWKLLINEDTDLYVSPYIVDAAGGPGSSYTTIQSAVTQAIADGATSVARNILIRPGSYAETFSISTTNAKLNFIGIGVAIASSSQPLISGTLTINANGTVIGFKDIFLSALTLTLASEIVVDRSQISAVNANLVSTFTGMDSAFTLFNHNYSSLTSTLSNCNIPTLNVTAGSSSVFGGTCATCNVSAGASASFFNCRGPNLGGSTGGTINLGGAVGSSNILSGSATLSQLESQQGNFILQRSISSSGNAANTDYLILVDSTGGAVTVTIPIGLKNKGRSLIIKDVGGAAASNNITITPTSATIDGVASKVISSAYGALTVFYNGTNYFTL